MTFNLRWLLLSSLGSSLLACGGTSVDVRDLADAAVHDAAADAAKSDGGGGGGGGGSGTTDGGPNGNGGGGGGGVPTCAPGAKCGGLTSCTDSCFGPDCCYVSCNCWSTDDVLHCQMTCSK